jgi:nucleoside-triphosphatase
VAHNLLLTGRPGVGKSTVIQEALQRSQVRAAGFFTQELREGGRRAGFGITTLDGQQGVLAHVSIPGPPKVSRYGVNVADIREVAVAALERALREADLIVCDEIARMELMCPEFAPMVRRCLDSAAPLLGAIQQRRDPFLDEVRSRQDVRMLEVTAGNREALVDEVVQWIAASRE